MKLFATLLAGLVCAGSAMAQTPSSRLTQPPFPTPEQILPAAPAWRGASERLLAPVDDPWITPAERDGLQTTPSYDQTLDYLRRVDAASPLVRLESFGRSAQGRELWAVIVARPDGRSSERPTLLAQGGIHSGEIDGKDAGLMLLRDIAFRGKARLLDRANLVFVPIFNVDGHERTSPYNRPNQRGPVSQGWRTTAQNLNLNRDYLKADSPEMRAMVGLIRKYDPSLYLDLHVTDGLDYAYDITFGFNGWDGRYARSPEIGRWLDRVYRPAMNRALSQQGHIPGPLIFGMDDRNPEAGLAFTPNTPRFSTGYGDLIRIPAVLVENHSLKPYPQRVLGTYVLIEESLRVLGRESAAVARAIAADRTLRPETAPATWRNIDAPIAQWTFHPVAWELYDSPASGRKEVRYLGRAAPEKRVPVFGQEPGVSVTRPVAYWIPATKPEVIERLRLHGVQFETLAEPRTVEVEMLRLTGAAPAAAANEGHVPIRAQGARPERRRETFPAGSVRVPTDQPLGELAMIMLEPLAEDSLFAWGFFPEILQRTEYIEGYAIAPLADRMLAESPQLKAEFDAALAADPKLAGDPDARLSWFYARTPYWDERHLLYPVGREAPVAPR